MQHLRIVSLIDACIERLTIERRALVVAAQTAFETAQRKTQPVPAAQKESQLKVVAAARRTKRADAAEEKMVVQKKKMVPARREQVAPVKPAKGRKQKAVAMEATKSTMEAMEPVETVEVPAVAAAAKPAKGPMSGSAAVQKAVETVETPVAVVSKVNAGAAASKAVTRGSALTAGNGALLPRISAGSSRRKILDSALRGAVPATPVFIPAAQIQVQKEEKVQKQKEAALERAAQGPSSNVLTAASLAQRWLQGQAS